MSVVLCTPVRSIADVSVERRQGTATCREVVMATPGSRPDESPSTMRGRAQHFAGQVADTVQETTSRVMGAGQEDGSPGSGPDQSASFTDQATEQVTSRLDIGKDYLVETVTGVAQALRQTGQHLRE